MSSSSGPNKILVRVHARASRNEVTVDDAGLIHIRTTAPPADGKANKAVAKALADYLRIPVSRVELLRGQKHRNKQFLIKGA